MASIACLEASVSGSCLFKGADRLHASESQQRRAVCGLSSFHTANRNGRQQLQLPVFSGLAQTLRLGSRTNVASARKGRRSAQSRVTQMALGEDPEFFDDDYIVVGLAHCFVKDDNSKLQVSLPSLPKKDVGQKPLKLILFESLHHLLRCQLRKLGCCSY